MRYWLKRVGINENWAIYIARRDLLIEENKLVCGKIGF